MKNNFFQAAYDVDSNYRTKVIVKGAYLIARVQVRGLFMQEDGRIVPIVGETDAIFTGAVFSEQIIYISHYKGKIISLGAYIVSGTAQRGRCYVIGGLEYNKDGFIQQSLFSHYLTSQQAVTIGMFEDSLSGRGFLLTKNDPSADASNLIFTGLSEKLKYKIIFVTCDTSNFIIGEEDLISIGSNVSNFYTGVTVKNDSSVTNPSLYFKSGNAGRLIPVGGIYPRGFYSIADEVEFLGINSIYIKVIKPSGSTTNLSSGIVYLEVLIA